MKMNRRIITLFALFVFILFTPLNTFAAAEIDLNRSSAITISYKSEGKPLSGASFHIYRVASVDEKGVFYAEPEFKDININFNGGENSWHTAALALEGYIAKNKITPLESAIVDSTGYAYFMDEDINIPKGLYIILGDQHTIDDVYYEAAPVLVSLPTKNAVSNTWMYDLIVNLKFDFFSVDGDGYLTRKVLKVWDNQGKSVKQPEYVTVHLLKNGDVYDTVTLNQENDWRHTWSKLDAGNKWTIYEEPVKNYTVEITRDGSTYVIRNTYVSPKPTPTPVPDSTPAPTPPPDSPQIDNFGQLWWPVPILFATGLSFIIFGIAQRRGNIYEE